MNQDIPKGVWVTLLVIAVIAVGYGVWKVGFSGPGGMSAEDEQRALMQAKVQNQQMGRNIPQGVPGAPPSDSPKPAEMQAREKMGAKF